MTTAFSKSNTTKPIPSSSSPTISIEKGFYSDIASFYCCDNGRPTVPIRLMLGFLILKHLEKQSDEQVVDRLRRDLYYQYLCGVSFKDTQKAVNPSTLTHFRKRIGLKGVNLIEKAVRELRNRPPGGKKRDQKTGK